MRTALFSLIALAGLTASAAAQTPFCEVADPTGTELNARTVPGGKVIALLPNGTRIVIRDARTYKGRSWVHAFDPDGFRYGWVFRDYLDCAVGYGGE